MTTPPPRRIQRFEVVDHLGTGGMGTVYRARDPQLDRDVAIKVLAARDQPPPELAEDATLDLRSSGPSSADDLLNEARMMARLSHQNVLPVYEVGLADGAVFVVMEHIDGTDLGSWLAAERSTAEVLDVFAQAARGLAAAHERGIVHRDVKPENILIGRDGRVRVADFGLSRLAAHPPAGAMVRFDDGRGTPRYMAPELWRGESATPKSDVYALCTALLEALGDRAVPARVRDLATAGVAEDPAARPALAQLLAALSGEERRRWPLVVGAAGGLVVLGVAAALVLGGSSDEPSCNVDPSLFAGRYDAQRREATAATLRGLAPQIAKEILKRYDDYRTQLGEHVVAACRAATSGQIGTAQRDVRIGCLTRRAFAFGATIDAQLAARDPLTSSFNRAHTLVSIADCDTMQAPPPKDIRTAEALWKRFYAAAALAVPDKAKAHIAELRAIEAAAELAGERELVGRAMYSRAVEHRFVDDMTEADAAFRGAQKLALELGATSIAIAIVTKRSATAAMHDPAAAKSLAALAGDLADRPGVHPIDRARALGAIGNSASATGDYKTAIAKLREALAIVMATGQHDPIEVELRFSLLNARYAASDRSPELVALGRETAQRVKEMYGERNPNYGVALNLLAGALHNSYDYDGALANRRAALDLMRATLPPTSAQIAGQLSDYATELIAVGRVAEARDALRTVVEQAKTSERLRGYLGELRALYAGTEFDSGNHALALAQLQQALEECVSAHTKDHPETYNTRRNLASVARELGKLDLAARELASLVDSYRARGADLALDLLRIESIDRAALALARGKPQDAEARARAGIARLATLHGDPDDEAALYHVLARSLVAQRRFADARDAAVHAREVLGGTHPREDIVAAYDVTRARAEAGLGDKAKARELAQPARAVLERFPGQITARREADALLATLPK